MPKTGDRVVVQGNKIGAPTRVGTLLKTVGSLIQVRWEDGSDSLFKPGAGSVTFEAGGNGKLAKGPKAPKSKSPAKAKPARAAAKPAAKAKTKAKTKAKPAAKAKPKATAKAKPAAKPKAKKPAAKAKKKR